MNEIVVTKTKKSYIDLSSGGSERAREREGEGGERVRGKARGREGGSKDSSRQVLFHPLSKLIGSVVQSYPIHQRHLPLLLWDEFGLRKAAGGGAGNMWAGGRAGTGPEAIRCWPSLSSRPYRTT